MPFKINFHRHPEIDEVHCHITYSGPEGEMVIRGRANVSALRATVKRLEARHGTQRVSGVMGCACSSNAISGELDTLGCECAYRRAARMLGVEPVGFLRRLFRRKRRAIRIPPPLTDQTADNESESEPQETKPAESEASGMFEIGDESTGFLPAAYYAYKQRRELAKVAKSSNPRAANAAKTLAKAKGGDPTAKRKIKVLSHAAKQGNPEAKDAMNRLHAVNKMTLLKPTFTFRDYYRAGLDLGPNSLKAPKRRG